MRINKVGVSFFALVLLIAGSYFWSQRMVELKIAGVTFRIPNPQIIIASDVGRDAAPLDNTEGAFLEIPNGPYFGKWGIFLQSSMERKGKGFPSPFDAMVDEGDTANALKMTQFGWYQCIDSCGRNNWYFRKIPAKNDSVYSIGSIICYETEICHLYFSYRDVDVKVSLQHSKIENAGEVMQQAAILVSSLAVAGK